MSEQRKKYLEVREAVLQSHVKEWQEQHRRGEVELLRLRQCLESIETDFAKQMTEQKTQIAKTEIVLALIEKHRKIVDEELTEVRDDLFELVAESTTPEQEVAIEKMLGIMMPDEPEKNLQI